MRFFSYIIWVLVILLGFTFACLNIESVTLHYYIGQTVLPLSLLLVLTLLLGVLLGMLTTLGYAWHLYRQLRKARHEVSRLAQQQATASDTTQRK